MSEFSESYHLYGKDQDDGISLLKRAGLKGYVFKKIGNWTTILPEGDIYALNDDLISVNEDILLRYIYAEDHGWGYELYKGSELISKFECDWADIIESYDLELNLPELKETMGEIIDTEKLLTILTPHTMDEVYHEHPGYKFAQLAGLHHYEWMSYFYLTKDDLAGELTYLEDQLARVT